MLLLAKIICLLILLKAAALFIWGRKIDIVFIKYVPVKTLRIMFSLLAFVSLTILYFVHSSIETFSVHWVISAYFSTLFFFSVVFLIYPLLIVRVLDKFKNDADARLSMSAVLLSLSVACMLFL